MMWNLHPNDVMALTSMSKRKAIHKRRSPVFTIMASAIARALRMKLVDDLWNIGFWSGCVRF